MSTAVDPIVPAVAPEWRPRFNPWAIAMTVTLATFMEVLDTSIANVALPHIAGNLSISQDEAAWVLTSYLVANAVILPISAWLSTKFGRKRFYMTCVVLFGVSSLMCGLAPNLPVLVFFRILQGLGGGGLAPTEQAILADTFPPEKRGQAFSVYAMAVVVAPVIGPTLGGYITDNFSWRWLFLINVPVAVVSLVLSARMLEDPPFLEKLRKKMFTVDYVGLGLLATGIGCLQVALDKGEREDWFASSFIVSFSVIAVVALVTAIIWEYHHPHPVLDVRLFKSRNFSVACIMMFMLGAALYGATVLIPQLLQTLMGYTAQQAGMVLSPGGLVIIATMPLIGRLLSKMDGRWLIVFGFTSTALALLSHDQLDARHRFQDRHDVPRLPGHRHGLSVCADSNAVLHRHSAGEEQQRQRHDQSRAQPGRQPGHFRDFGDRLAARAISSERAGLAHQPVRLHFPTKRGGPHADLPDARLGRGPRHHHGAPDALWRHAAPGRAAGLYRRDLYLFADLRRDGPRRVSDAEAAEGREGERRALIFSALRLGASDDSFGPHDESIGRRADEVERITRDQRQDLVSIGLQYRDVGRIHNFSGRHPVAIFAP